MNYYVEKCIYWNKYIGDVTGWQINNQGCELFWVNLWLSTLTTNTAKQYAYKLCKFLNYLDSKQLDYTQATVFDLDSFVSDLRFRTDGDIYNIGESSKRHSTIRSYISAIGSFYGYLQTRNREICMKVHIEEVSNKYSFLYNISWNKTTTKLFIDKNISKYKPKRNYIKWYSDDEIEAIYSNLRTVRDKAIFALTLCGMRIDEVLSLRVEDYDITTKSVVAYRSKRRVTGDTNRAVSLDYTALRYIEDYLNNERIEAEIELINRGQLICNELFVGLKHNRGFGKPVTYLTYLSILKRAAKRAGIDESKIRTHSGRSTIVMRDLLFHAEHPDILSLEDIRKKYGWSNISSMDPYLDTSNPMLSLQNRQLLDQVKKMQEKRLSER